MRKRYVYDKKSGKVVPKGAAGSAHMGVLPDIQEFVTTDGVQISSRSHLRAYERETGLEQCGDDHLLGTNDDGSMIGRIIDEMPSPRHDIIEAFKRHNR